MNIDPTEPILTVKDLAKAVALDQSERCISTAMRQIRHWTECDLLKPITPKRTGTGIARLYTATPTLEVAAILVELSRYGVPVEVMKPLAAAICEDIEEFGDSMEHAMTDEAIAFAQIAWAQDPETGEFSGVHVNLFNTEEFPVAEALDTKAASYVLLNLNKIMERVPFGEISDRWYEKHELD